MSILLDALRRLEDGSPAKPSQTPAAASGRSPAATAPAATAPAPGEIGPTPPSRPAPTAAAAAPVPRAVRIEEPAAPPAVPQVSAGEAPAVAVAAAAGAAAAMETTALRTESTIAERRPQADFATVAAAVGPVASISAKTASAKTRREPAFEPRTWEAAYVADWATPANVPAKPVAVVTNVAPYYEAPAAAPASPRPAVETVVELPRAPKAFDCRALAAALRRLRPEGGRFALVSIGQESPATGTPAWSAELADELGEIAALPVERFASGGLLHEGDGTGPQGRGVYRLYFVGAEFAAGRGAALRGVDAVLLVVHEGATSLKAAEVVRGAMAAQSVEFAGFVYVTR